MFFFKFNLFLLHCYAVLCTRLANIWFWMIFRLLWNVFKLVSMAIFGIEMSIQGPEWLALPFFVIFCYIYCQADPLKFRLEPNRKCEIGLLQVNWKKATILNIRPRTACNLKVNSLINQFFDKKSPKQEKMAKFLFVRLILENLDFGFSAPFFKIFNNNEKKFIKAQTLLLLSTTIDQNIIGFGP